MARDPAFLFYPGDWLGGTMTFNRHHKGAYMDVLMAQFNSGHLSIDDVKFILGPDFDLMWESKLKPKFKTDAAGKFFNEKLEFEINRRKKFVASRTENLEGDKKTKTHKVTHMDNHTVSRMENENENGNTSENLTGVLWESIKLNFKNGWKWKEKFCVDKKISMVELEKKMDEFITDIELKEEYKNLKDIKSHFVNWFNKNGRTTHQQFSGDKSTKLGTSEARTAALKKW